jgi:hypothetical protein
VSPSWNLQRSTSLGQLGEPEVRFGHHQALLWKKLRMDEPTEVLTTGIFGDGDLWKP